MKEKNNKALEAYARNARRSGQTLTLSIVHSILCTIMSPRRRSRSGAVRKITKTGTYTYYITLPKVAITELGWRARQKVVVKRVGKRLVIEDWKR
jgi:hypothetical protein